jgi:hypothetical protein
MKIKNNLTAISGTVLTLSFLFLSCSSSKRTAVSCPDFSSRKINEIAVDHNRTNNKYFASQGGAYAKKQSAALSGKNHSKKTLALEKSSQKEQSGMWGTENIYNVNKIEYSDGLMASAENRYLPLARSYTFANSPALKTSAEQQEESILAQTSACDTIVLKSGSRLIGKVEEIGQNEIKYRRCDNLNGPLISISKYDAFKILYSNGTLESFPSDNVINLNNNYNNDIKPVVNNTIVKTEGLAIAGFVIGLAGLFVAGIPLGLIAGVFGILSLSKIKKYPGRFKGRGLAIASIILGIADIAGAIVVLSTM